MIPTVINFDKTRIPVEGSPTFRADASYVWGAFPAVIDSQNASIAVQNSSYSEINGWNINVNTKHNEIVISASDTLKYRNDAVSARDEIKGYVVPTNATYTPAEIDNKIQNTRLESFLGFNF